MKGLIVLKKRIDGATATIRIIVTGVRNAKFRNFAFRGQVRELHDEVIAPPLLEGFLLLLHFVLAGRAVAEIALRRAILGQRGRNQ